MKSKKILISVIFLLAFFSFFGISDIYAGACDSLPECHDWIAGEGYSVTACGCEYDRSSCYCGPNDICTYSQKCEIIGNEGSSCPIAGTTVGSTTYHICDEDCCDSGGDDGGDDGGGGGGSCTPGCTPFGCPTGTSDILPPLNVRDLYATYSCTDDCGDEFPRNCYCDVCDLPQCSDLGYRDTELVDYGKSWGKVPDNLTAQCWNGNVNTPFRTTRCDLRTRDCYCGVCWPTGGCPSGTKATYDAPDISDYHSDVGCTNDCNVSNIWNCYCDKCIPSSCRLISSEFDDWDRGFGKLATSLSPYCRNGLITTPDRTTKCDLTYRDCYCNTDCVPSCPSGTTKTNTGDYHSTPTCYNACNMPNDDNCYCSTCSWTSTCADYGYSSTSLGYGTVPQSLSPWCRNGLSTTPDRTTKCDIRYRTCYCPQCPLSCPSPLSSSQTVISPNMILQDFDNCINDCSVPNEIDCYERPSDQPLVSLTILESLPNHYEFSSLTHSGMPGDPYLENLNNPVRMRAEYFDPSPGGAADIEGMFVWFREENMTGTPVTPIWLGGSNSERRSPSNNSWGFMMRREPGGWFPYTAHFPTGASDYDANNVNWRRASEYSISSGIFYIKNPENQVMVMVRVRNSDIELKSGSLSTMQMTFELEFSDSTLTASARETRYRIYLLGLDRFSFTPHDNYSFDVSRYWPVNKLRYRTSPTPAQTYARSWTNTGYTWTVDKHLPGANLNVVNDGTEVLVSWQVEDVVNTNGDARGLYAVVGNVFLSGDSNERKQIEFVSSSTGISTRDAFIPENTDLAKVGILQNDPLNNYYWSFRTSETNLTGSTHTGNVRINIGENSTGSLEVYLTAFDDAGNIYQNSKTFYLGDWMVTDGGLVYSQGGSSYQTRELSDDSIWQPYTAPGLNQILPPIRVSDILPTESLKPTKADLSSELWAESILPPPQELTKSNVTNSYNIRNFPDNNLSNYYIDLMKAYEKRREGLIDQYNLREVIFEGDQEFRNVNTLGNDNFCGNINSNPYCVLIVRGSLTVDSLVCNHRAAIFVEGDLRITRPINFERNGRNRDACIFIVQGDVSITKNPSVAPAQMRYDSIHAYILTDKTFTIGPEKRAPGAIVNGVYINGGFHARQGTVIQRYLRFTERVEFPALAVDHHPKYGVLGGIVFGNTFTIQKTQVGLN